MKKIAYILCFIVLAAAVIASFSSCKEEESQSSKIIGVWSTEIDLQSIIDNASFENTLEYDPMENLQLLGINLSDYNIAVNFEFKEKGKLTFSVDNETSKETMKRVFSDMFDSIIGIGAKTEGELVAEMNASTREEAIEALAKRVDFSGYEMSFDYSYMNNKLVISTMLTSVDVNGDTLTIKSIDAGAKDDDSAKAIEAFIPLTLTRK